MLEPAPDASREVETKVAAGVSTDDFKCGAGKESVLSPGKFTLQVDCACSAPPEGNVPAGDGLVLSEGMLRDGVDRGAAFRGERQALAGCDDVCGVTCLSPSPSFGRSWHVVMMAVVWLGPV